MKPAKKRNRNDATERNVKAANKKIAKLKAAFIALRTRVKAIEQREKQA